MEWTLGEQEAGRSRKVRAAEQETGEGLTGFCKDFGFSVSFERSQKPLEGLKQKSGMV